MKALHERVCTWLAEDRGVALATVTHVSGSAPFLPGSVMAVNDAGDVCGSISIGCIESAIVQRAQEVIERDVSLTLSFDSQSDALTGVALPCGGALRIRIDPIHASADLLHLFAARKRGTRLYIAGANPYTQAVCDLALRLDYDVTVIDPRPAFATPRDFGGATVHCGWPDEFLREAAIDEETAVLMLSHDARYDAAFLAHALRSQAFYVGAIGSRRTQAERRERLRAQGLTPSDLARLHGPCGLDLGAEDARETAIAMLAEVIAVRHHRDGASLRDRQGPIHDRRHGTATLVQSEESDALDRPNPVAP